MVSCAQITCSALIFVIGFILNALYQVGEFNLLFPKNIRHCKRIEGYHGCEDFAYFANKNVYMSCDDRSWLKYHAPTQEKNLSTRIAEQYDQGKLYLLPANNYEKATPVKITGYKFADFHPLGIASLEDKSGKWLFVTDNQRDGEKVNIFKVVSDAEIKLIASLNIFEPYQMLNDIIAIPNSDGSFYVTIWLTEEPGTFWNFVNVYLKRPVSYILFCEPKIDNFLGSKINNKNKEIFLSDALFSCKKVVEGLKMINGITRNPDATRIYAAETIAKSMNIYQRNIKNNELSLIKTVNTFSGCDNLEMAQDGYIYLGCHPKALTFQLHAEWPEYVTAPSRVLKFKDNNSENDEMEIIMESTGEILSGSSLGLKMDNTLIVGSVHDDCYLLCDQSK